LFHDNLVTAEHIYFDRAENYTCVANERVQVKKKIKEHRDHTANDVRAVAAANDVLLNMHAGLVPSRGEQVKYPAFIH
jgi:hypothetical protein